MPQFNFSDWPANTLFRGILIIIGCLLVFRCVLWVEFRIKDRLRIIRRRKDFEKLKKKKN